MDTPLLLKSFDQGGVSGFYEKSTEETEGNVRGSEEDLTTRTVNLWSPADGGSHQQLVSRRLCLPLGHFKSSGISAAGPPRSTLDSIPYTRSDIAKNIGSGSKYFIE